MISSSKLGDIETTSGLQKLLISFKRPVHLPKLFSYFVFTVSYLEVIVVLIAIALKEFKCQPDYLLLDDIIFYTLGVEVTDIDTFKMDREIAISLVTVHQAVQIIVFAVMLFQIFIKKQNPNPRLNMIFRILIILNYYIFFLPIQGFIFRNFVKINNDTITYSNMHSAAFLGLNVFCLISTIIFSFIGNFAYSQIQDKDYFAKRNAKLCFLNYLYKLLVSIFLQLTVRNPPNKWILLCFSAVFILLSYYYYYTELVFYQVKIVKLMAWVHGNMIACCVAVLAVGVWDEIDTVTLPRDILVIWILLLPFAVSRESDQIKKILLEALRIDPKKMTTEEQHFKRILGLKWIFSEGCHDNWKSKKRANNPLQITVIGLVKSHMVTCKNKKCPCDRAITQQEEKGVDRELSVNKVFLNEVLKNIIEEAMSEGALYTLGKHNVLLDKARFHLRKEDKFLRAYLTFKQLKSKSDKSKTANKFSSTSLKLLEQMIEEAVKGKCGVPNTQQEEKLHIKELIRHQELVEDIKVLMTQQTEKQLQLWGHFNESTWNAHHLFKLSREIEGIRSKVEATWSSINSFKHNDLILFLLFGLYSSVVNNNILRSEKLLKKIDVMNMLSLQSAEGQVTNANLYDASNMLISIGMDKERLGKIEGFTRNVLDVFGYTSQELMSANVAILMPSFLRKRHQKFLIKYMETQIGRLFNSQRGTFGMSKKGYALPLTLYISVYPTLRNGLSYFSVLRPMKDYKEYILLRNNGYIDACTENISKELGLVPNSGKRIHIADIAPDMMRINSIFVSFVAKQIQQIKKEERAHTKNTGQNDRSGIEEEEETGQITSNLTQMQTMQTRPDAPLLADRADKSFNLMTEHQKSFNLMTDAQLDSASPRKTTLFETGMETTFRAVQKDTGLPSFPTPTRKTTGIVEDEQTKAIHEKFSTEGDVITFYNTTDKTLDFYYNCQITEEIYGESVLRILTLVQSYKKSRFEELEDEKEDREANVSADERSSHWQQSPNNRRRSLPYLTEMKSDVPSPEKDPIEPPIEAEEESFINNDVPDEKYVELYKSKRSDPAKSFMINTDAVSATSRFHENFLEKETNQFDKSQFDKSQFDKSQFDKSREPLVQFTAGQSFHHKMTIAKGKTRGSDYLGTEYLSSYTHHNSIERRGHVMISSGEIRSRKTESPKDPHYITTDSKNDKKSKSPAVMNTDPIKKFFQQHSLHIRKDGDNSSTGTTSSASSTRILRAVEKAFGEWRKVNKYVNWIALVLTICIIAFGTMIGYFISMKLEFDIIRSDSSSLFHVGRRMNAFVELIRGVQFLDLYTKGYVTRDRHAYEGIEDYIEYLYADMKVDLADIISENTILRDFIEDLSTDLQTKLYSDSIDFKIVNETNTAISTQKLNTFDAVTEIAAYATEIVSAPSTEVQNKQYAIQSILENSFNDLTINMKKPYDIYSAKIEDDFSLLDVVFSIAIAVVCVSFALVLWVSNNELQIISKDTVKFWESLQRFELRNAEAHKTELRILVNGFRQNHTFDELFSDVNNMKPIDQIPALSKINKGNSLKDSGAFIKRHHNWTKSMTYLPTMIPASLTFILFIITLAASRILISSQKNKRDIFITELVAMDNIYQTESLATTFIYKYVISSMTGTVLNQPISTALDTQLSSISNIQSFINSFNGLDPVLQEDLCTTVIKDAYDGEGSSFNATDCALAAGGSNTKGLASVVSYLAQNLQYVKDYYDGNYQSPTVVADTLELTPLKSVESEFDYLDAAFVSVADNLDISDQDQQSSFSVAFFLVLFLVIAVELLIWAGLISIAYKNLRKHKENHALLMRNIPIILIWESKLMRGYIFTLFKGSFQNIKQH